MDIRGDLYELRHLKREGENAIPSLSGMPPFVKMGDPFWLGDCQIQKHRDEDWDRQCPHGADLATFGQATTSFGTDGGCAGQEDYTPCPEWYDQPHQLRHEGIHHYMCMSNGDCGTYEYFIM